MLAFTVLCLLLSFVHSIPLVSREVFDPPITSPDASTVWTVGQTVTVTWDTSNLPPDSQLTNPDGQIVLGYMANDTDSEHLMLDSPLAQNFKLSAGQVSFTVPSVVTRNDYIVVLFGDSGNRSPMFTIEGSAASSTDTASSASSTSPTSAISLPVSGTTTITREQPTTASPPITTTDTSVASTLTSGATTIVISSVSSVPVSSVPASSSGSSFAPASSSESSSPSSSPSASSAADSSSNGCWKTTPGQGYAIVAAGLLVFFNL